MSRCFELNGRMQIVPSGVHVPKFRASQFPGQGEVRLKFLVVHVLCLEFGFIKCSFLFYNLVIKIFRACERKKTASIPTLQLYNFHSCSFSLI